MATDAQNLITIRSNLLADMATESANPKATYSIDGQSVSWNEWWNTMLESVQKLDALISASARQGVVEVRQRICP